MSLSFWEYLRLGAPQWRGQPDLGRKLAWLILAAPDMHTRIRNCHVCNVVGSLALPEDAAVLDVGCGRGVSLFYLAHKHSGWRLTGLELDDEMVVTCQRAAAAGDWSNLSFVQADVNELAGEQTFDLVLCMDVLEHVPDDLGLLSKIRQALKPGGYAVLHVPRYGPEQWRFFPAFKKHHEKTHVRDEYKRDEFGALVTRAGFRICGFHETFGWAGELAFELNQAFWRAWALRQAMAILTYPLAVAIGYLDTRRYQVRGNSFLVLAQRA